MYTRTPSDSSVKLIQSLCHILNVDAHYSERSNSIVWVGEGCLEVEELLIPTILENVWVNPKENYVLGTMRILSSNLIVLGVYYRTEAFVFVLENVKDESKGLPESSNVTSSIHSWHKENLSSLVPDYTKKKKDSKLEDLFSSIKHYAVHSYKFNKDLSSYEYLEI